MSTIWTGRNTLSFQWYFKSLSQSHSLEALWWSTVVTSSWLLIPQIPIGYQHTQQGPALLFLHQYQRCCWVLLFSSTSPFLCSDVLPEFDAEKDLVRMTFTFTSCVSLHVFLVQDRLFCFWSGLEIFVYWFTLILSSSLYNFFLGRCLLSNLCVHTIKIFDIETGTVIINPCWKNHLWHCTHNKDNKREPRWNE